MAIYWYRTERGGKVMLDFLFPTPSYLATLKDYNASKTPEERTDAKASYDDWDIVWFGIMRAAEQLNELD
jgi:hypothetical protein